MNFPILKHALAALILLAVPCAAQTPEDAAPAKKAAPAHRPRRQVRVQLKDRAKGPRPLDINTATKAQLQTLPGVTAALADKIVAGRPYYSKAALEANGILPQDIYLQAKDKLMAVPPPLPRK